VLAALAKTVRAPARGDLEHLGRGHGTDPAAVLAKLAEISDVSQRMAASSAPFAAEVIAPLSRKTPDSHAPGAQNRWL
jgi:hypothetical protein